MGGRAKLQGDKTASFCRKEVDAQLQEDTSASPSLQRTFWPMDCWTFPGKCQQTIGNEIATESIPEGPTSAL